MHDYFPKWISRLVFIILSLGERIWNRFGANSLRMDE